MNVRMISFPTFQITVFCNTMELLQNTLQNKKFTRIFLGQSQSFLEKVQIHSNKK